MLHSTLFDASGDANSTFIPLSLVNKLECIPSFIFSTRTRRMSNIYLHIPCLISLPNVVNPTSFVGFFPHISTHSRSLLSVMIIIFVLPYFVFIVLFRTCALQHPRKGVMTLCLVVILSCFGVFLHSFDASVLKSIDCFVHFA